MAISSPLLENSIEGARGVLLNISAGSDLTLDELYEAANVVARATDTEDAFIITGCVIDETLGRNGNGIRSPPRWKTNPPTTTSAPMSCAIWTVSEMKSGSTQSSASMKATNSPCATLSAAFRAGPRLR